MSSQRAPSAELQEEGARLGAELGLEGFRGAHVSSFRAWAWIIPRDVLFMYDKGVARRVAGVAPVAVRWGELATLTVRYTLEDGGFSIASCALADGAGNQVAVRSGPHSGTGVLETVKYAEHVLSQDVLPGIIAAYDRGETVVLGGLAIDKTGIGPARSGKRVPWAQVKKIIMLGPGMWCVLLYGRLRLGRKMIRQNRKPNSSVSYLVVRHAAAAHPHVKLKFSDPDKRVPFARPIGLQHITLAGIKGYRPASPPPRTASRPPRTS